MMKQFERIYEFTHKEHLMEMSNLRKKKSKLPVNVWIDDSSSYKRGKHYKRIKFQTNYGDKLDRSQLASMDLNGNEYHLSKNAEITQDDVNQVRNFVINNRAIIEAIADQDIDFEDFITLMIPGGQLHGEEIWQTQLRDLQNILQNNETV